jgi:hypothetical protein
VTDPENDHPNRAAGVSGLVAIWVTAELAVPREIVAMGGVHFWQSWDARLRTGGARRSSVD